MAVRRPCAMAQYRKSMSASRSHAMPDHAALARALDCPRASQDASELHGSISALACALAPAAAARLLDGLVEEYRGNTDAALQALTQACLAATMHALNAAQVDDYVPLLPGDASPLAVQADALVGFCRGFLEGLGLAGVGAGAGRDLPAATAEALQAFAAIAAGPVALADADVAGERAALAELTDFVRIGVMLVHAELGADPGDGRA